MPSKGPRPLLVVAVVVNVMFVWLTLAGVVVLPGFTCSTDACSSAGFAKWVVGDVVLVAVWAVGRKPSPSVDDGA